MSRGQPTLENDGTVRGETIKLLAFTTTLQPTIKKKTSFPFTLLDPVNFPFFSPGGTENCHKITLVSSLWSAVTVTVTVSLKFSSNSQHSHLDGSQ